ncbi:hypothetical protein Mal4_04480 [Maioricimonas rarisocia]|uniref:Uncharacterized protein n=2 Tax=Maioricimonas rarisocia TaxID=2528026 RepID=A0A517Z119_9PLAN|nr:hypothetical protein Mal4_04480 [Maioricimonas rarisocia]
MSDDAFELINTFYDGVDIIVRELAEQIAVRENSFLPDAPEVVAIEKRHVQQAGNRVIQHLRSLLDREELPKELGRLLGDITESVHAS